MARTDTLDPRKRQEPQTELATPAAGRHRTIGALATIVVVAFVARVVVTYRAVFGQEYVGFVETDAWYHMRLVDALVRDFPWRIWHDPYLVHPGGEMVNAGPVFDWIVAAAALVLGLGAPSPRLIDVVGAYIPPVIGALTSLPVYVLGREIVSRRAGLWAAFIVAVIPGQIFFRGSLGFTDHHCAEVLFSTMAFMFVVLALGEARSARARIGLALAGGASLGTYLLTWGGGVLVVGILLAWAVLQLAADRLRGETSTTVLVALGPVMFLAALMVTPWVSTRPHFTYQLAALVTGLVLLAAAGAGRRFGAGARRGTIAWAFGASGAIVLAAAVGYVVLGERLATLLSDAARVSPFRSAGLVAEAAPLRYAEAWRPIPLWREFTTSLFLAVAGMLVLLRDLEHGPRRQRLLLLVWTMAMLGATAGQVRFAYYLAVGVALLAGAAVARGLDAIQPRLAGRRIRRGAVAAALVIVIVGPGAPLLWSASRQRTALTPDWRDALAWLEERTPPPFEGDPYYRTADAHARPTAAYGILAWWEYGYWITRVGRRVPTANPRQTGLRDMALFYLAQDETAARRVLDRVGARYVAVDWRLQALYGRGGATDRRSGAFAAIVQTIGRQPTDYCGAFVYRDGRGTTSGPAIYCYPEYFRSMAVRLYLYGDGAVTPRGPVSVVAFTDETSGRRTVKRITSERTFRSYEDAQAYVAETGSANVRIVCKDPQATCVPLEALEGFRSVFRSLGRETAGERLGAPLVQVFEYVPELRPTGE